MLTFLDTSPELQGHDMQQKKKVLKQLFVGNNPQTALTGLVEFTQVLEAQDHPCTAQRPHDASVNTETTATNPPPSKECKKFDKRKRLPAVLAAALGGIGIATIGVGIAFTVTGLGAPVGIALKVVGGTLLAVVATAPLGAGAVAFDKAFITTKKRDTTTEKPEEGETPKADNISNSAGTSASCTSYNPLNLPVKYNK